MIVIFIGKYELKGIDDRLAGNCRLRFADCKLTRPRFV